jgi:transcriptional regulator with XRE-family HTH domain
MNIVNPCFPATVSLPPIVTGETGSADKTTLPDEVALPPMLEPASDRPLHRLAEARRQEGISRRKVAVRLGIPPREVTRQEQPTSDILLSDLYRWQEALKIPVTELLSEPDGSCTLPVQLRAKLVLLMKTVRAIEEAAHQPAIRRLAQVLDDKLVEIMPELKDTVAWPAFGRRRPQNELGQAFFRRLDVDPPEESASTDDVE